MASASARMVAMRLLETISGLSVPAAAIAGAAMLIPRAAPITLRKTARLIPIDAHTIASTILCWHNPSYWFRVRREVQPGPFIKLAKPLNPVKPQSLYENYQAFNYHNEKVSTHGPWNAPCNEKSGFEVEIGNIQGPNPQVGKSIAWGTEKSLEGVQASLLPTHENQRNNSQGQRYW